MTYIVALLCTSACYFFIWVAGIFTLASSRSYDPAYNGLITALALLYPLSFFGSLSFVALNQRKSDKWFLGLPLPIVILTLILSPDVSEKLFVLLLVLAAPASALFILSVPEEQRESVKKYVKAIKVVSVYAAISGFIYFMDTFLHIDFLSGLVPGMFAIYAAFGLPSIGICLVLMAKEKRKRSDSSPGNFGKITVSS